MKEEAQRVLRTITHPPEEGWKHHKCPLCELRGLTPDRRGALSVSHSGYYRCHRCASTGWVVEPSSRNTYPMPRPDETPPPKPVLPPGCYTLVPEAVRRNVSLRPAWDYLLKRGLSHATIIGADIRACISGRYAGRVILPIKQGAVVEGFIARSWEPNAKVPYLYPKGMRRAELFYGDLLFEAERARRVRAPHVLVEGAFDALSVWPYGLAVLGKPSQWQVKRLIEVGSTVAVCLDGDALDEGWSLALVLRVSGVRAGAVWLPPVTDPDEIPRQLLLDAARRCIDAPEPVRIER